MNRINKLVLGVTVTLGLLIPSLTQAQVISTAPQTWWRETDQTLPLGMWHVQVRADKFYIEKNTDATGAFGTTTNVMSVTGGLIQFGSTSDVAIDTTNHRLGIGTATPVSAVEVKGDSASSNPFFTSSDTNVSGHSWRFGTGLTAAFGVFTIRDATAALNRVTIYTDGRLSLGALATDFSISNGSAVSVAGSGTGIAGNGTNFVLGVWNGPMTFQVGNDGVNLKTAMIITTSGLVGIGASPSIAAALGLHISAPATTNAAVKLESSVSNGYGAGLQLISKTAGGSSTTWSIGTGVLNLANNVDFYDGTVDVMTLKVGGGVGIGGSPSVGQLDVLGSGQISANLRSTAANGGYSQWYDTTNSTARGYVGYGSNVFGGGSISDFGVMAVSALKLGSGGSTVALTIDTSQNVGIGVTSSISSVLEVRKSGAGIQDTAYLTNTQAAAAGVGSELSFANATVRQATIQGVWTGAATTDGYLSFKTRQANTLTEILRLNNAGQTLHADGTAGAPSVSSITYPSTGFRFLAGPNMRAVLNGVDILVFDSVNFYPLADNSLILGGVTNRFSSAYIGTSLSIGSGIALAAGAPSFSGTGFGSPMSSITGNASAMRITVGTAPGASGIALFGATFTNAPVCYAENETTGVIGTTVSTTTQVTVTIAMVATNKVAIMCLGF